MGFNNEEEKEMTPEEIEAKKQALRENENEILQNLILAAEYKTSDEETREIVITRSGKPLVVFKIRPLGEDEFMKARRDNTKYKKAKGSAVRTPESVDGARYRSQLIYEATVEADRSKVWDNRKVWERLSVINGIDMVDCILKAGEKDAVIDQLEEISGYKIDMEETAKN